jgi:hypothetical protein
MEMEDKDKLARYPLNNSSSCLAQRSLMASLGATRQIQIINKRLMALKTTTLNSQHPSSTSRILVGLNHTMRAMQRRNK